MTYIPSSEIKQPQLHADTLGFTFLWHGHFLRGIYPDSVELANSYFNSGFIYEVVAKGLFPKTWVSEYENEQFGMIIEHEVIKPELFATEWNSAMLKDAALMVLNIAEMGWKYGYNMVDCHKLNVMFKNNLPIYVDLGSFVPNEKGCTGWKPYKNFLESYTYILDMWTHGCPQMAKRMMSPGVIMRTEDYLAWKYPLFRTYSFLLKMHIKVQYAVNALAGSAWLQLEHTKKYVLAKKLVDFFRLGESQRLYQLRKQVKRMKVSHKATIDSGKEIDIDFIKKAQTITCINIHNPLFLGKLKAIGMDVISLQESDLLSNSEYISTKKITSVCTQLLNGAVLVRDKYPENRLQSEIVLTCCNVKGFGQFELHNTVVYLKRCMMYSTTNTMYVLLSKPYDALVGIIKDNWIVKRVSVDGKLMEVCSNRL